MNRSVATVFAVLLTQIASIAAAAPPNQTLRWRRIVVTFPCVMDRSVPGESFCLFRGAKFTAHLLPNGTSRDDVKFQIKEMTSGGKGRLQSYKEYAAGALYLIEQEDHDYLIKEFIRPHDSIGLVVQTKRGRDPRADPALLEAINIFADATVP